VVFLDLEKYSDESQGLRLLRTDEYIQMAGRAGRRGKDDKGYVFYLPQREPVSLGELQSMMTGRKSAIQSQMDFGYDFVLKTFQAKTLRWMDLLEQSYWYRQVRGELEQTDKKMMELQGKISDLGIPEEQLKVCQAREDAETKVKTAVNAERKKAQQQLESMKNKQMGPAWDAQCKKYQAYKELSKDLASQEAYFKQLKSIHLTKVEPTLDLLKRWGFLSESNELTELGVLGSEINEGQPILMARAFQDGVWKGMTQEDFVAFLAGFLNEGKTNNETNPSDLNMSEKTRAALNFADDIAYRCEEDERKYQLTFAKKDQWAIHTTWIEPLLKWMEEEEAAVICSEYGLYEGNFIRSVLKVANMVEEWTSLATFTKSIELLQLLEGLKERLVRDIVRPESLYLNLN
jgi:superfamily II RNA helicase